MSQYIARARDTSMGLVFMRRWKGLAALFTYSDTPIASCETISTGADADFGTLGAGTVGAADIEVHGYGFAPSHGFSVIELRTDGNSIRCVEHTFESQSSAFEPGEAYWIHSAEDLSGFRGGWLGEEALDRTMTKSSRPRSIPWPFFANRTGTSGVAVNYADRGLPCAEIAHP